MARNAPLLTRLAAFGLRSRWWAREASGALLSRQARVVLHQSRSASENSLLKGLCSIQQERVSLPALLDDETRITEKRQIEIGLRSRFRGARRVPGQIEVKNRENREKNRDF